MKAIAYAHIPRETIARAIADSREVIAKTRSESAATAENIKTKVLSELRKRRFTLTRWGKLSDEDAWDKWVNWTGPYYGEVGEYHDWLRRSRWFGADDVRSLLDIEALLNNSLDEMILLSSEAMTLLNLTKP